jgi:hypothetical protein
VSGNDKASIAIFAIFAVIVIFVILASTRRKK